MKTHIRDNHAEYRKIETSGLNPNRFEPKFCLENVKKKKHLNLLKKTFEVILNEKIRCTEHEGDEIRCSQSCLSYYQPVFAEHVTKIGFGFLG